MKKKGCYICGSLKSESLLLQRSKDQILELIDTSLNKIERNIVMCTTCGFCYHEPTLEKKEIEVLYEKYRSTSFRKESPDDYFDRITSIPSSSSFNYKKTIKIDSYISKYTNYDKSEEKRNFLDVGTGGGVFIKTFLDNSKYLWNAYGVEPTPNYAELASRRLKIDVKNKFYGGGLFQKKFNLITSNKVLEHTEDPIGFLKGFSEDIVDKGLIYIEVPSIREVMTLPHDHKQLSYDHLIFFSKETLRYVAIEAGLKVLEINEIYLEGGEVDLNLIATKKNESDQIHLDQTVFPLNIPSQFKLNSKSHN